MDIAIADQRQLDLKATVTEGEEVVVNRKSIAEKAFKQLSM